MHVKSSLALAATVALALSGCGGRGGNDAAGAGGCDPGITDDSIKLGISIPMSGGGAPYAALAKAQQAYFESLNEQGGVKMGDGKTRKVTYVIKDDAYDPARTVANTKELVEKENVFAMTSVLGTSPNEAIGEYMTQKQVPNLFSQIGSDFVETQREKHKMTIAALPQYKFETQAVADHVKETQPNAKVALLYQNDGFGKTIVEDFNAAFEGSDVEIVGKEAYEVSGNSVDAQMTKLKASGADVLLTYATATFATQAIKKAGDLNWKPKDHILFSGSNHLTLVEPAGAAAKGVHSFGYLKDVHDPQWKDDAGYKNFKEFAENAKGIRPDDGLAGGGTVVAQYMEATLKAMKGCKRSDMMEAAQNLKDVKADLLLNNLSVNTTPEYPYTLSTLQLQEYDGTSWKPVGEPVTRKP